jgi:hypothetical protein
VPEPTLASTAKASSSAGATGLKAINDQLEAENSNDHAVPYMHWWPKKGTAEWVQYDLASPATIAELAVYWFDDTGVGECRVPASWKAFYRSSGEWVPAKAVDPYGVERDKYNVVRISPVKTDAVRLEIQLPEKFSTGIHEWRIK